MHLLINGTFESKQNAIIEPVFNLTETFLNIYRWGMALGQNETWWSKYFLPYFGTSKLGQSEFVKSAPFERCLVDVSRI